MRGLRALFFIAGLMAVCHALAQYPSRPVRMLVGFPPGGANDIVARIAAQKLSETLGQPVVVENRPGNAGVVAAEVLAKAASDGYTLMLGSTGTNSIAPALNSRLPYDPVNAFVPVGLVGIAPSAMPERLRSMPDIPTVAEQGLPGYEMSTWYGVFAPAGTPAETVERLGAELRRAVADPKVREQIAAQGIEPVSNTPAEFRAFVNSELEKWARVVKAAGIKGD